MYKYLTVGIILFGLNACVAPTVEPFRIRTYENEPTVSLPATEIEIVNHTSEFVALPHIENKVPTSPVSALTTAIQNHFTASHTGADKIVFTINEASLIQKKVEDERWYVFNNIEYLLSYKITITRYGAHQAQSQDIVGWEKQSLPNRSSLADKEQTWQVMIDNMTQKVLQKIETDLSH